MVADDPLRDIARRGVGAALGLAVNGIVLCDGDDVLLVDARAASALQAVARRHAQARDQYFQEEYNRDLAF